MIKLNLPKINISKPRVLPKINVPLIKPLPKPKVDMKALQKSVGHNNRSHERYNRNRVCDIADTFLQCLHIYFWFW